MHLVSSPSVRLLVAVKVVELEEESYGGRGGEGGAGGVRMGEYVPLP